MIGDKLQTKYFGEYIERKDSDIPVEEIEGKVISRIINNKPVTFLYVDTLKEPNRYDLPAFMHKYDKQRVAVLARKKQRVVGSKTYYKLIVISAKSLARSKKPVE